ncbi:hypothetical protein B296_00008767 [Ensete ventricosum]|uniref:Uncharacterized protein n=1 Tax=Ensete ventricosum TaxID=4639 RepID=A0A427ATK8_ENSVE|nr:hypothetical protein B296_00008767 [Ensete ventricosum]
MRRGALPTTSAGSRGDKDPKDKRHVADAPFKASLWDGSRHPIPCWGTPRYYLTPAKRASSDASTLACHHQSSSRLCGCFK